MTTTAGPRHARRDEPERAPRRGPSPAATLLSPAAALFATVGAATSLTGVLQGGAWLAYVAVAALLVACTGLALRSLRVPTPLVGLGQLVALLLLVTGVFTGSGVLGVLPGPAAFTELNEVLTEAFSTIRNGVPPVEATAAILCLATIAIGLVAIVVDTLVVAAAAPAATGLILLCVYAVPSALADDLLPWWTFVLGAAAFAALLAVDGSHRHHRWRNRPSPGAGVSAAAVSAPVTVVVGALSAGLVAGAGITAIGTEGSLPGSDSDNRPVLGGLGVNPFTSLRGMLDQGDDVPLFRVSGLGDSPRPMRAFTLDTYRPNEGWGLADGPMPAGVPANGTLPSAPGDDGSGEGREIRIEPVHWNDVWLPVFGAPRALRELSGGWYYDRTSGSVFRERRQTPQPYVEVASLDEPSRAELREVESGTDEDMGGYTDLAAVDPRVVALAEDLTADADTRFDQAQAVWEYFGPENGFVYDTETAPATDGDALSDFLLNGKRGYCEQYASAMAVMLRSLDIPARVAVGFTSGYRDGDVRTITSRDAHAWVEVYFGDLGWVSFDPTPLSDGRGYVPPYLSGEDGTDGDSAGDEVPGNDAEDSSEPTSPSEEQAEQDAAAQPGQQRPFGDSGSWPGLLALVVAGIALVATVAAWLAGRRGRSAPRRAENRRASSLAALTAGLWGLALVTVAWWVHWIAAVAVVVLTALAATPWAVRRAQRRRHLRQIEHGTVPQAADAAWRELVRECADRGVEVPVSDTVRLAAQRLAQGQRLDERGKNDLRTIVTTVERSWYGSGGTATHGDTTTFAAAVRGVLAALDRAAPLSWRGRLLPRSVLQRRR
ncbi:transglutaminase [Saccharomonospora piscinae]|uniref:Transglutaminase n=1 Tax=Saccharomonospora piscinae TaxID=687388 RepID=A0A1V9AAC3_SACPI|nr:DUF3488 and transglutaminase-like domain-containing protein [Saccharomonospora piscinae]OQO94072.1 transglutaminase [Saccharomonospora piscinae]